MALERWEVKVLCIAGLFLNQLIFILLPLKVSAYVNSKGEKGVLALSTLSCFGGGVFFGAYLMHLSPEVRLLLEDALLIPEHITYPVTEAITGFGFFLILFIEMAVMTCQKRHDNQADTLHKEGALHTPASPASSSYNNSQVTLVRCSYDNEVLHPVESSTCGQSGRSLMTSSALIHKSTELPEVTSTLKKKGSDAGDEVVVDCNGLSSSSLEGIDGKSTSSAEEPEVSSPNQQAAMARSAIFIVALSMDSIFEGLSLGLKVNSNDVITLFIAIISHEFIMSFCIGLELVKHYPRRVTVGMGIAYALTPVIGAAIGTAIVETADYGGNTTVDIVNGVLQSICAGAFIYCAFIGILSEELTHSNGLLKASVTLLGFAFMAGMAAIPDSSGDDTQPEATTMPTELTTI